MNQLVCVVFLLVPLFCGAFPQNGISQEEDEKGMECYRCTSEENSNCARPAGNLPTGRCKDPKDRCITAIVDGVTHRGCKKELNVPSNSTSETCGFYRCNNKLFPKDRLKCYQCQGWNCKFIMPNTLQACVNFVQGDSCVTDVISENDVIRGCKSDLNYSHSPFAEFCQGYGCNNHPISYSAECVSCSEVNSTTCVRISPPVSSEKTCKVTNSNTCRSTALLNRPTYCFTYKASNKVVRGCPQDAGKLAEDINNYKLCERNLCNNDCIPIKCVKCDSRTHPKCATEANEFEPELCPNDMACFVDQTSDGATIRGCGEQFTGASKISTCYEDGCIKELPPISGCIGTDCNKGKEANPSTSCKGDDCKKGTETSPNVNCHGDDCNKNTQNNSKPGCTRPDCNKGKGDPPSTSCKGDDCKKGIDTSPSGGCHGDDCNKNTQIIPIPSSRADDCNTSSQYHPVISVNGQNNFVLIYNA